MNSLWVFGYGSLLWDPGFDYCERVQARLDGWCRSFCMRSIEYRGSVDAPGLVLALDVARGGHCDGLAFAVPPERSETVLAYLRKRELVLSAYLERRLALSLVDGRKVEAVSYVIDHDHPLYCGLLEPEDQARIIAAAKGERGSNAEYLFNTASHLGELGIADPDLDRLAARVRALTAATRTP